MSDVPEAVMQWCGRFATAAGVASPTEREVEEVLALAAIAAHESARQAAPVTCWLAAKAGLSLSAALDAARSIADAR